MSRGLESIARFGVVAFLFVTACGGGKEPETPVHTVEAVPPAAAASAPPPQPPTEADVRTQTIDDVRRMRGALDDPSALLNELRSNSIGAQIVRDKLRSGAIPPVVADAYLLPDKNTGGFKPATGTWATAIQKNRADIDKVLTSSAGEVAMADNPATLKQPEVSFDRSVVYFATDRAVDDKGEPLYERGKLRFGECEVVVPPDREHPQASVWNRVPWSGPAEAKYAWYATQWRDNALEEAAAIEAKAASDAQDAVVFIHGFNNTLEEACARAGRIRSEMDYHGPIFMFSWPAHGGSMGAFYYDGDQTNATSVVWQDFVEFLSLIQTKVKPPKIHVIAHSMGAQITVLALQSAAAVNEKIQVGELILAAGDVDADGFVRAGRELSARAERVSVYGSQGDRAMLLSKKVAHRYQRIGGLPPPRLASWFDMIDASKVNTDLLPPALGHGYLFEKTLLRDVRAVLAGKKPTDPERDAWLESEKPGPRHYAFTVQ